VRVIGRKPAKLLRRLADWEGTRWVAVIPPEKLVSVF
jgi:hypothetical protein